MKTVDAYIPPSAPNAIWKPLATLIRLVKETPRREQKEWPLDSHAKTLAADVVGLPCEHGGDISIGSGEAHKDTEVSGAIILGVGDDHQSNDAEETLQDDEGSAQAVFVGRP